MTVIPVALDRISVNKLIDAAGDHRDNGVRNAMLVRLMYSHALRLIEACGLRWRQFDMFHCRLTLKRKSGTVVRDLDRHEMGVLRDLKAHCQTLGGGGPNDYVFISTTGESLTPDGIRKIITKAAKVAGLAGVNPRALRRTAGTHVAEKTGSVDAVQSIMGVNDRKNVVMLFPEKKIKKQPTPWA